MGVYQGVAEGQASKAFHGQVSISFRKEKNMLSRIIFLRNGKVKHQFSPGGLSKHGRININRFSNGKHHMMKSVMRYDIKFLFVCVYHIEDELNHRFILRYWKYVGRELTPVDYVQININHKRLKRKEK